MSGDSAQVPETRLDQGPETDENEPAVESRRQVESVEGTTRWMRSEGSEHVFCYTVDLDPWKHDIAGVRDQDIAAWAWQAIRHMPEGARVRFTVEVVDA